FRIWVLGRFVCQVAPEADLAGEVVEDLQRGGHPEQMWLALAECLRPGGCVGAAQDIDAVGADLAVAPGSPHQRHAPETGRPPQEGSDAERVLARISTEPSAGRPGSVVGPQPSPIPHLCDLGCDAVEGSTQPDDGDHRMLDRGVVPTVWISSEQRLQLDI